MIVGVANYKVGKDHNPWFYLKEIQTFLSSQSIAGANVDLFVGPDYALTPKFDMAKPAHACLVRQKLKYMSKDFPNTVFVPGTMPFAIKGKQMVHAAFVYRDGKELEFRKQTDHGEAERAEGHGLTYFRETGKAHTFDVKGKKAWLSICGDRERKPESVCKDADLEIVVAHDLNAGFHLGINSPTNARHIILSDSSKPKCGVMKYDPSGQHTLLNPISTYQNMEVFELK